MWHCAHMQAELTSIISPDQVHQPTRQTWSCAAAPMLSWLASLRHCPCTLIQRAAMELYRVQPISSVYPFEGSLPITRQHQARHLQDVAFSTCLVLLSYFGLRQLCRDTAIVYEHGWSRTHHLWLAGIAMVQQGSGISRTARYSIHSMPATYHTTSPGPGCSWN